MNQLYPVTVVGSFPRPRGVLEALREKKAGRMSVEKFNQIAEESILHIIRRQEEVGVDYVSDGEQRRDNFISFVSDSLNNVKTITVSELMDYIEDRSSFEEILGTLDVPAYSLTNPAAIGKISRKSSIAVHELKFLKNNTTRKTKICLPGPYLLMRSMWIKGLSDDTYPNREDLALDIVKVLREEIEELIQNQADFIQLDEPVLTEVVFTRKNENRTFMCGALTHKSDVEIELKLAVDLLNQVTKGFRNRGTKIGVHICRGNWSTKEEILLSGPYTPLVPFLKNLDIDQLVLEFSTERAGQMSAVKELAEQGFEIGLGAVNPRTDTLESIEFVRNKVQEALTFFKPEKIFLNPDCGFCTFSQRPMNVENLAYQKLARLKEISNQFNL